MFRTCLTTLILLLLSSSAAASPGSSETQFLPLSAHQAYVNGQEHLLITAFVPDGLLRYDTDEAIAIANVGMNAAALGGYRLSDGEATVRLPALTLPAGELLWCARQATAFAQAWGWAPACEYEKDTDADVPDATGKYLRLGNNGDEIQLLTPGGAVIDTVVYADGDTSLLGWQGAPVPYYHPTSLFTSSGQVFYRLFDAFTLQPWPDTNQAADWAQGNRDPRVGRRLAYPGWAWRELAAALTVQWSPPTSLQLAVAPDNSLALLQQLFSQARNSIWIEVYELSQPQLVQTLVDRAQAGVDVRILLEGAPVGGFSDDERWAAQQITQAGGRVSFMVNDIDDAHDRYPYLHAKFAIIDSRTLLLSSENFKTTAMPILPADGKTSGHRGYMLAISDAALVARATSIFVADANPAATDIFAFRPGHERYGNPPADYVPPSLTPVSGDYAIRYPAPISVPDARQAQLFTAPESSLSPGPLLALIDRAGSGDVILVQQLYEQPYWGAGSSSAAADPNPRLEALQQAARRGATVRLLLDSTYDRPANRRSNAATVAQVTAIATHEGLDMQVRRGNPTGAGIHAKLHLLALGPERWVVISSINGSETSNKLNREIGLAVQTAQGFAALQGVFWDDWALAGP